jgi:fibronectin type 3 domain-containing protein
VYRRDGDSGPWRPIAADLVLTPAYRDAAVVAGQTYSYRITAVSTAGNESAPSAEVTESAPTPTA